MKSTCFQIASAFAALAAVSCAACGSSGFPLPGKPSLWTSDSAISIAGHNPALGDRGAPVTIVAFVGFGPNTCAREGVAIQSLRATYGDARARIVFRHADLSEPGARRLAEAAQAVFVLAGSTAFLAFSDALWARNPSAPPTDAELVVAAGHAGISDARSLLDTMASKAVREAVDADWVVAARLGATRCPVLYINGREMSERTGAVDADAWRGTVEREEKHADTLLATGVKREGLYAALVAENMASGPGADDAAAALGSTRTIMGGLQLTDVVVGKGAAARNGDTIRVHYTGKLADGSVFDSSIGKSPFEFVVGRGKVIRGWDLGLAGMKPGGKRKLVIPPGLAYGSRTTGTIPPNSTLAFDVELLEIR
jgi:FKBP-type peptidyl-prolyl cis-trans isomerase/protein-disulfide isomerase